MHCEHSETLLTLLVTDELADGEEKQELLSHLEQCEACRERLGDMRVTTGLLREAAESGSAPKLSAERRAALFGAVGLTAQGTAPPVAEETPALEAPPQRNPRFWRRLSPMRVPVRSFVGAAAAAMLLVCLYGIITPMASRRADEFAGSMPASGDAGGGADGTAAVAKAGKISEAIRSFASAWEGTVPPGLPKRGEDAALHDGPGTEAEAEEGIRRPGEGDDGYGYGDARGDGDAGADRDGDGEGDGINLEYFDPHVEWRGDPDVALEGKKRQDRPDIKDTRKVMGHEEMVPRPATPEKEMTITADGSKRHLGPPFETFNGELSVPTPRPKNSPPEGPDLAPGTGDSLRIVEETEKSPPANAKGTETENSYVTDSVAARGSHRPDDPGRPGEALDAFGKGDKQKEEKEGTGDTPAEEWGQARYALEKRRRYELLARAKEQMRQKNYGLAEGHTRELLEADPLNPEARSLLAKLEREKRAPDGDGRLGLDRNGEDETNLPTTTTYEYPEDWKDIIAKRPADLAKKQAEAQRKLTEQMEKKISFDFVDTPLSDVVAYLSKETGANIVLDPAAVQGDDVPVTLKVTDMRANAALGWVLRLTQLDSSKQDEALFVSSKERIAQAPTMQIYEVRDLLAAIPDYSGTSLPSVGEGGGDMGGGGDDLFGDLARKGEDFTGEDLVEFIRKTIEPSSWDAEKAGETGGKDFAGKIGFRQGKLVVMQTGEGQAKVRRLLDDLRKSVKAKKEGTERVEVREENPTDEPELPKATFKAVPVNPFVMTARDRFSTFAIDVDTASYAIGRSYIRRGYLPPAASVRMEEYVNAFDYNYPSQNRNTFTTHVEAAPAPFGRDLTLVKVGIRGKVIGRDGRKPAHLVFVVDTSGSMAKPDRMPLVQQGLAFLLGGLSATDRVSLVTYGTDARLVLEAVPTSEKKKILEAAKAVRCGGSTNLVKGVELGYAVAGRTFRAGHTNRVILCSDGVANVGLTAAEEILEKVKHFREQGITFTSVGFGAGSYNDALLERLANQGDGAYEFVDSCEQARHVFGEQMAALQTIAKDMKIQVEFDARRVRRYRLIGYENRDVADKDFRNDAVDAGEVGSGQSATALYEVELLEQPEAEAVPADLGTVHLRYRTVDTNEVEEVSYRLESSSIKKRAPKTDPRFFLAAAVAEFAEILRQSEHAGDSSLDSVERVLAQVAVELPLDQKVKELLQLVRRAKGLPRAGK